VGRTDSKNPPRSTGEVDPESMEGRGAGASRRTQGVPSPIPGGRPHIGNHPSVRREPPIPAPQQEYRGILAHGVPEDTYTTAERADMIRGGPNDAHGQHTPHHTGERRERPLPVPVYMVQPAGGPEVFLTAGAISRTMPANGGEPIRLCGRDPKRARVLLLNEDASHNVRFAQRQADLISGPGGGGGALLPKGMTSYLVLSCQDELWAWSADSGTPAVSIVQEYEQEL